MTALVHFNWYCLLAFALISSKVTLSLIQNETTTTPHIASTLNGTTVFNLNDTTVSNLNVTTTITSTVRESTVTQLFLTSPSAACDVKCEAGKYCDINSRTCLNCNSIIEGCTQCNTSMMTTHFNNETSATTASPASVICSQCDVGLEPDDTGLTCKRVGVSSGSATGAIVGSVIGALVLVALVVIVIYYVLKRRRLNAKPAIPPPSRLEVEQLPSEGKTYENAGKQLSPDETDMHHDKVTRYTRDPTLKKKPDNVNKLKEMSQNSRSSVYETTDVTPVANSQQKSASLPPSSSTAAGRHYNGAAGVTADEVLYSNDENEDTYDNIDVVAAVAAASAAARVYVNINEAKSPDYVNKSVINSLAQNKNQAKVDGKSDATNINNHHYQPMNANARLHTTPR